MVICMKSIAKETFFSQGNQAYANENYDNAISIYDSIISSGLASSEVFYNIGNCYYKTQDWANAIWHYEKALRLNPNNQNASYNLKLTKLKKIDQIEVIPKIFYKKWWNNLISLFSTKNWQILSILSIWIALTIQLLKRNLKYKRYPLSVFFNTLVLILFSIYYSSYQENYSKTQAIIFASSVNVNSAPTVNSTNLFSLHSGTKVEVVDEIGNWLNIEIENGDTGWIQRSSCKKLN